MSKIVIYLLKLLKVNNEFLKLSWKKSQKRLITCYYQKDVYNFIASEDCREKLV